MRSFEQQIITLGYGRRDGALLRNAQDIPADHPFAPEIRRMFAPRDAEAGATAVFMHGGAPLACLVDADSLPTEPGPRELAVRLFCRRLWNQNLASVVLVLGADEVSAYSVLDPAAAPQRLKTSPTSTDGPWSHADLSSGRVWERHGSWFDPKLRVDNSLLANIVALLKVLCAGPSGLTEDEARHSLSKAIFVCFLEQRGIVGETYRARHEVATLLQLVSRGDRAGLERLFDRLRTDFNGDFLNPVIDDAAEFWDLPPRALSAIGEFLERTDLQTGQRSFWGYDFSEIPIELISGIYQTFLATKGQISAQSQPQRAGQKPPTQKELGAFYTPRHLAVYVVEQAFTSVVDPLEETIFDGACGSGILLTTAYRNLLRLAEHRKGRPPSFEERRDILKRGIFGSDIDRDACRLTAFSLYLALLSELEPRDLAIIQEQGGKLPNLIGANLRAGPEDGDVFGASAVEATKGRFSLVISNPPWREPDADEVTSFERWLAALEDAPAVSYRQIAIAYVFRALECLKPGGRVSLVLPVRLIVGDRAQDFRAELVERMKIDQVVNFADMRRLVFPGAKHPFVVISGGARDRAQQAAIRAGDIAAGHGEVIEYLVPKADVALAYGRLAIHGDDRITLPASTLYADERLFGLRYWGTEHDVALLRKCRRLGRLEDLVTETRDGDGAWLCNSGWVGPYKGYPGSDAGDLRDMRFLDARTLPHVGLMLAAGDSALRSFPADDFSNIAFFGERELYRGPRVIWPDGVSAEGEIRAVFSEAPFTFRHSIKAIGGPERDRSLLQFLAAYLRSPLAQYLMILGSHTVSGERPKLHKNELLAMPFVRPEHHPNPDRARSVLAQVSEVFQALADAPDHFRGGAYDYHRDRLNALVLDYFELDEDDRVLVLEMVERVAPSIQPSSTRPSDLLTPLLKHPSTDDLEAYRRKLQTTLEAWRDAAGGSGAIKVSLQVDGKNLLGAAIIELGATSTGPVGAITEAEADAPLWAIGESLGAHVRGASDSAMLTLPHLTVASGRTITIVKPLRVRFWLQRSALADADRLVGQIRASVSARTSA
ncbi:N-6 DNA methylase [soil metagenome]